jgi:hypothetical protein
MLEQKITTKGANFVYPLHMKKTPSVLMYIELKIVRVLSYFIRICTQYELCILIQCENVILWKMVRGRPL